MTRRALLVGCQTGGLSGVHADVELMRTTTKDLDFETTVLIGPDATQAGILDAYRRLVAATVDGDAVLVYYSGHGARLRNPFADDDPREPAYLQFVVPTDFDDAPEGEFRGILAAQLSLLQAELTQRTPNVTTVLDCCHSARMSRDASRLPRARDVRALVSMAAFEAARETALSLASARPGGDAAGADANPWAVRVVACAPEQSAYEVDLADGTRHGALTAALARMLADGSGRRYTWRQLLERLRPAVLDLSELQRPEIEGPADRYVFTTDERTGDGLLPVVVAAAGGLDLDVPSFLGLAPGDAVELVADGDQDTPLATAVVDDVVAGRPRLALNTGGLGGRTSGLEARPTRFAVGRRPVTVVPPDTPAGREVAAALAGSPHTVLVGPDAPGLLASVEVGDDGFRLLDAGGQPLHARARSIDAGALMGLRSDVAQLARAAHLRDLPSGRGETALPDDVVVEYARLATDGVTPGEIPLATGDHLFDGDRVVVRLRNTGNEQRFVSVFDIGLRGAVTLLSTSEPSGLTLAPGDVYELYRSPTGTLTGMELYWPEDLPRTGPRPESVVVLVMDRRQDLSSLRQPGVKRGPGEPVSELQRLVDALSSGLRDARPAGAAPEVVRYRVDRLDVLLHPQRRGDDQEPFFEIDTRPDRSFLWVTPRSPVSVPDRVAVRLSEVVVHSNRAVLRSGVRVDALVVTRTFGGAAAAPYQAATARFDRVRDGDRLPLDNLLLYEGPVASFVDLAVWVARDDQAELDLADLLAQETGRADVQTALATLVGLAVAAPQAAVAVASVAAVATLVRTGAALLDKAVGKSIGVYRTSLLPHERFGAGDPVARHPASGLLRAQDMSFAFEVVATT